MRVSTNTLIAAFLSAAILAACGGNNGLSSSLPTSVAPQIGPRLSQSSAGLTAEQMHAHSAYSLLYSFKGQPGDGGYPEASLTSLDGTLYGTTELGGPGRCVYERQRSGCGGVFAITTSGAESLLRSFRGGNGEFPLAGLLNINGTLYGTTSQGGRHHGGMVFAITTSGMETVLHSFAQEGFPDGHDPAAGLVNVNGTLYGTTYGGGGATDEGTVFAITTSGRERVLYSFGGGSEDGAFPYATLIDVNGTLYGTTTSGGASACFSGCGTVFSITTSGAESVLYKFAGGSKDGANPYAGLINVKGMLYGTTIDGGANGDGTVFSITMSGKETVLHSFAGAPDGANPQAGLIDVKGTLYGTTGGGGGSVCFSNYGCGTVYAITTSGKETILRSFSGAPDGAVPQRGLTKLNGRLYGTTVFGGSGTCTRPGAPPGCGTVFSLTP